MKFLLVLTLLALARAMDCCEYSLEGGQCDDSCPGVCVLGSIDDCPNLVEQGCYLLDTFTVPTWDSECSTCVCQQSRSIRTTRALRTIPQPTEANKYGFIRIPKNIKELINQHSHKKNVKGEL
jgi:hypothetical protein